MQDFFFKTARVGTFSYKSDLPWQYMYSDFLKISLLKESVRSGHAPAVHICMFICFHI